MNVTIENNQLVIKVDLEKSPSLSSTGKSLVVASTHGFFKPALTWLGKPLSISLNVIVPAK